jgi:hypothetical protein
MATFVGASFIFRQSEYIARIPPAHPNIGAYVEERNISVGICAAFTRQLTIEMLDMGIPPDRALLNMKMRHNSYFGQLARTRHSDRYATSARSGGSQSSEDLAMK